MGVFILMVFNNVRSAHVTCKSEDLIKNLNLWGNDLQETSADIDSASSLAGIGSLLT